MKKTNGVKNMQQILDYAITSKRFIGGFGKLKKDGSIAKLNGQIFKRSTTKKGDEYVVIDNFLRPAKKGSKKSWQMVLLKNLITLNENGWQHKKVA